MDCLHPLTITNPNEYERNKGHPTILVPCGKCESCIISNANEWRVRLKMEYEQSDLSYFVTLTYNDDKIPLEKCTDSLGNSYIVPVVCKRHVQLFLKRLRKLYTGFSLRYFCVAEYGPSTLRPHYHLLLFGLPREYLDSLKQSIKDSKRIEKCWSNGNVMLDPVTDGRIAYVTKYMSCTTDLPEYLPKPFRLMSRRPGIGASYLDNTDVVDWHRRNLACYYPDGGFKHRLPRYLKDKIFDDDMKSIIRENIDEHRKQRYDEDIALSKEFGFSNYLDYRKSACDRLIRKFNGKYKKTRKDF